jgi:hypothetical protein
MRTGGNQIPGTMPVAAPAWCPGGSPAAAARRAEITKRADPHLLYHAWPGPGSHTIERRLCSA